MAHVPATPSTPAPMSAGVSPAGSSSSAIDQRPAPAPAGAASHPAGIRRQFISFSFHKLMPEFRRLPRRQQGEALAGLVQLVRRNDAHKMLLLSYSCVGTRPDVDWLFWKISYELEEIQRFSAALNRLPLAGWLTSPQCFLAQSKRSTYVDKIDPAHDDARLLIVPGKKKYLFVYPFVKTRDWYLLSRSTRQGIMDEHIAVGNKYPAVKLNTTYSFGIDDQEFVVAFETDKPDDFLDLVQELRETEGSRFTLRDTPIFTCVQTPIEELIGQLADMS